jgi:hypothetical protein
MSELRQDRGHRPRWSKIPHDMIGSVSPTALAVAAALAKYADAKTGECWPTLNTLAAVVKKHRNTVRKAVADLEAAGWLERTQRRRLDNRGNRESGTAGPPSTSNLYRLLWIAPGGYTAKSPPSEGEVHSSRAGGVHSGRATELEPVDLEPPLPPIDSHQEPSEAAGVGMESVPDTPTKVLNLDDKRAARYRSQVLDELARLEAEADAAAGTQIRSPGAYLAAINRRLADDLELAARIDAYQGQYPDDTPVELAGRIWADRSPGARPPSRPTVEDQSEEGYARRVNLHSTYASELVEVFDLGGAQ